MPHARSRFAQNAESCIHFLEWGAAQRRAVVLWHAMTGRCTDHASLARTLANAGHYVIAPDAPGCGLSDWSKAPREDYSLAGYTRAIESVLSMAGVDEVDWIGSSVGGFIGVNIAAGNSTTSLRRLILNETGIVLPQSVHESLRKMLASPRVFDTFPAFEAHLRKFLSRGGAEGDDEFFREICASWARRTDDGGFISHHDPKISSQFTHSPADFDQRATYKSVTAPTLLLRAAVNSMLTEEEAREIASTGPEARVFGRPGGHISFMTDSQTQSEILEFLKTAE